MSSAPWIGQLLTPAARFMSNTEFGIYRRLLEAAWNNDPRGLLPDDDKTLRRLSQADTVEEWESSRAKVLAVWVRLGDGTIRHDGLVQDAREYEEHQKRRSEAGRKAAATRWENEKRSSQSQPKQKPRNANRMRVACDSHATGSEEAQTVTATTSCVESEQTPAASQSCFIREEETASSSLGDSVKEEEIKEQAPELNFPDDDWKKFWGTVVRVTGINPAIRGNAAQVGKAVKDLKAAGYSEADVAALPEAMKAAGVHVRLFPSRIKQYIHLVREQNSKTEEERKQEATALRVVEHYAAVVKSDYPASGALPLIVALLASGLTEDALKASATAYGSFCDLNSVEGRFRKSAKGFFGNKLDGYGKYEVKPKAKPVRPAINEETAWYYHMQAKAERAALQKKREEEELAKQEKKRLELERLANFDDSSIPF